MSSMRLQFVVCMLFLSTHLGFELNPPTSLCSDYEMLIVNTKQCVSRCPIVCKNKICYENDECPCDGQYQRSENGLICAMECLPGCNSAGGYCAAPNLCLCRKGYYFNKVARRCFKRTIFHDRCFGRCLHGECTTNGECICAQGFENRTSNFLGQRCVPFCQQNCGPHGYCFLPNMCACRKKHYHYESDGRCHKDIVYLQ